MIVVDVECTGLNPRRHSLLSIGAVDYGCPERIFYGECRAFPGAEVNDEALRIAGFSQSEAFDLHKPALEILIGQFFEWADGCSERTLAGQNPDFDRDFLRASAERFNLQWDYGHRVVDLHSLAYGHQLSRGISSPRNVLSALGSDQIYHYVGLPEEPRPHNALTGASMEAEAFSRLLFGRTLLQQFLQFPVPSHLAQPRNNQLERKTPTALPRDREEN